MDYLIAIIWHWLGMILGILAARERGFPDLLGLVVGLVAGPLALILYALKSGAQCPHCFEWVRPEASVCRHCHRDLTPSAAPLTRRAPVQRSLRGP
jgi:hypothetical protein